MMLTNHRPAPHSPPALSLPQHQGLFQSVAFHQVHLLENKDSTDILNSHSNDANSRLLTIYFRESKYRTCHQLPNDSDRAGTF